jgi:hypothetical protein
VNCKKKKKKTNSLKQQHFIIHPNIKVKIQNWANLDRNAVQTTLYKKINLKIIFKK